MRESFYYYKTNKLDDLEKEIRKAKLYLSEIKKDINKQKNIIDAINTDLQIYKFGSREKYLENKIDKKCGVYEFHNKINDYYYIGSSGDLDSRYNNHLENLGSDKFHQDLHKYGIENFEYKVIQYCINRDEAYEVELNTIHDYQKQGMKLYNKAGLLKKYK